jgi:hypothetical protein
MKRARLMPGSFHLKVLERMVQLALLVEVLDCGHSSRFSQSFNCTCVVSIFFGMFLPLIQKGCE